MVTVVKGPLNATMVEGKVGLTEAFKKALTSTELFHFIKVNFLYYINKKIAFSIDLSPGLDL